MKRITPLVFSKERLGLKSVLHARCTETDENGREREMEASTMYDTDAETRIFLMEMEKHLLEAYRIYCSRNGIKNAPYERRYSL